MEIEKQRGISVSSSVLQFEYENVVLNLLDTPGHKDFSEDTYRTLAAADAAVMLIDAAKGVEPQTRKLFEVCRLRALPVFTIMNKMDRPSRDPFDLMGEVESVLGIETTPMTWPIGLGDQFRGVFDLHAKNILVFDQQGRSKEARLEATEFRDWEDPKLMKLLAGPQGRYEEAEAMKAQFLMELECVQGAGAPLDAVKVLEATLSPVFFCSAMQHFGVEHFLRSFIQLAPPPGPVDLEEGRLEPEKAFAGFIFKIQANMDPQHRDRVAFMRVASGHFQRGLEVQHVRCGKKIKLTKPVQFFAQERKVIEEAWPGDIVGLLDTSGELRIGDTLAVERGVTFKRVPQFAPSFFSKILLMDPMKRKQLKKGLDQLGEEGVVQVYTSARMNEKEAILGAVGVLQFEVLVHRLRVEYGVEVKLERLGMELARWIKGEDWDASFFDRRLDAQLVFDRHQRPVVLFQSEWVLKWCQEKLKNVTWLSSDR
jgi:peptide chain release factor 3